MKSPVTIAAVVVTYNRKELLIQCIESLLKQSYPLDRIYIIDNASTDNTKDFLQNKNYFDKIKYIYLSENIGGAGGFYEGVKEAFKDGYHWIWLMDDDAEPTPDSLEKIVPYLDYEGVSALANLKLDSDGGILYHHQGYFNFSNPLSGIVNKIRDEDLENNKILDIDFSSFVGLLVNKKVISEIGFPNKDFFIHHDDVEYCIRLRSKGKILLVQDSIIYHKEAAKKGTEEKKLLWKKSTRIPYEKLSIKYYAPRNLIYLSKKYGTNKVKFILGLIKRYIRLIIGILLFDDRKLERIKFFTNAYLDGLRGKLGKVNNKLRRM